MNPKIRLMTVAVLIAISALCSGSVPRRDLRTVGQVAGIALDVEDGVLVATFELYSPSLEKPIGKENKMVTVAGADLEECIHNACLVQGKQLFADDALVLILNRDYKDFLVAETVDHYRLLKNDQMDLPVFFSVDQPAGQIFKEGGEVVSLALYTASENTGKQQTVLDLINGEGTEVLLQGEGGFQIVS